MPEGGCASWPGVSGKQGPRDETPDVVFTGSASRQVAAYLSLHKLSLDSELGPPFRLIAEDHTAYLREI